jgi:hypothetical protein
MIGLVNQGRDQEDYLGGEYQRGNCQGKLFSAKINSRATNHAIKHSTNISSFKHIKHST